MWKRLAVLWTVVRGDARLLWMALRHPRAPGWLKLGALGIVAYLFSPLDLIPDFIPLFGVMDDVVIVPLAIRWLLNRLPVDLRADIERQTGFWAGGKPSDPGRGSSGFVRDPH
ncbi:MAG TPA: YkvA family protein [Burkholderiaceae bacterium]|jgi:uncharacterized membrane protein YkvA (DUF1232 family)|nr:YkvA family protein [Burkholderiaceae bacterium]